MQSMLLKLRNLQEIKTQISEKYAQIKQTKEFYSKLFSENLQEMTVLLSGLKKMWDLHTRSVDLLGPLQSELFDLSRIQQHTRSLSDEINHLTQQVETSMSEQKGTDVLAKLHVELKNMENEQALFEEELVQGFWALSDDLKSIQYQTADVFSVHPDDFVHILVTEHSISLSDALDIVNLVVLNAKDESGYNSERIELVKIADHDPDATHGLGEDPFEINIRSHRLQQSDLDKSIDHRKNQMIISGTVDVQIEGDVALIIDEGAGIFSTDDQHWLIQGYTLQEFVANIVAHVEFVFDMDRDIQSSDVDLRQEEVKFTLPVISIEPKVSSHTLDILASKLAENMQEHDIEEMVWEAVLSGETSKEIEDTVKYDIEETAKSVELSAN